MAQAKKPILFVVTSHNQLGDTGKPTGLWLEELATHYYLFKEAGFDIEMASPKGGEPPVDPTSQEAAYTTEATRRFEYDFSAKEVFLNSLLLEDVHAEDFSAVFYPGGHGPLWDLVSNKHSIALIESFWQQGKPVSAVCHAPIVLVNAKTKNGDYLIDNRRVTGFSNTEESAVGLTEVVPFLVEDTLKARGAQYSRADDFAPHVVQEGMLVTGQNPASSAEVAKRVLSLLI